MFYFVNNNTALKFKGKNLIKTWLNNALKDRGYKCGDITIVFVTDCEILSINKSSLSHDYPTDIITFDYSHPTDKKIVHADLFISADTVLFNSKKYPQLFKPEFACEICRVLIHGILHLIGEDDLTVHQQKKMRKAETKYLMEIEPFVREEKILFEYNENRKS